MSELPLEPEFVRALLYTMGRGGELCLYCARLCDGCSCSICSSRDETGEDKM